MKMLFMSFFNSLQCVFACFQGIIFGNEKQESAAIRDTFVDSLGPCTTPARNPETDVSKPGDCIPVKDCPSLLVYLRGPQRDITYLRRTICRIINATPYVCCPVVQRWIICCWQRHFIFIEDLLRTIFPRLFLILEISGNTPNLSFVSIQRDPRLLEQGHFLG